MVPDTGLVILRSNLHANPVRGKSDEFPAVSLTKEGDPGAQVSGIMEDRPKLDSIQGFRCVMGWQAWTVRDFGPVISRRGQVGTMYGRCRRFWRRQPTLSYSPGGISN